MELTFINVGYGEAILIRDGRFVMLIDGGSDEDVEYAGGAGRIRCVDAIKALGVDHIDVMLNTHIHEDHTCGLWPVAQALPVGAFWTAFAPDLPARDLPLCENDDASTDKFIRALNVHRRLLGRFEALGVPVRVLRAGDADMRLTDNLMGETLGPESGVADAFTRKIEAIWRDDAPGALIRELDPMMNNASVILRLCAPGGRALLVGDTNRAGYGHLADTSLRAEVFKVGHHGQIDGVTGEQLLKIAPKYVVFTASSDRRYNSAHPDVVEMVRRAGAVALFTDSPYPDVPIHQALTFRFEKTGIEYKYENVGGYAHGYV